MKKLIMALSLLATPAFASEVDSFHRRFEPLADALPVLNEKANQLFREAIIEANLKGPGCQQKKLYRSLRKRFRNHVFDQFNKWLIDTDRVEKIVTPIRQTIYGDFNVFQSPIQGGYARVIDPTGVILNVNGIRVGNDKFEHFMGSGFRYFETYYLKGGSLESALAIGWRAETGYMGAMMTGVMSYADMVANFQGMRFWNHMLQEHDDIFGENIGPYLECEKEQWAIVKPIDFSIYVDAAFDEGINCSRFRTDNMTQRVLGRIAQLEQRDPEGRSYACPLDAEALERMDYKYAPIGPWLINTQGHQSMENLDIDPPSRH